MCGTWCYCSTHPTGTRQQGRSRTGPGHLAPASRYVIRHEQPIAAHSSPQQPTTRQHAVEQSRNSERIFRGLTRDFHVGSARCALIPELGGGERCHVVPVGNRTICIGHTSCDSQSMPLLQLSKMVCFSLGGRRRMSPLTETCIPCLAFASCTTRRLPTNNAYRRSGRRVNKGPCTHMWPVAVPRPWQCGP